jgi:hypothetical protein
MTNYLIGAVVILFIATLSYCEVQKKQEIKEAIEKTQIAERNSCENMISEANLQSTNKTIKTIKKYETIKSNLSKTDINQRTRLLQQLEDFNFAD